MDGNSLGLLSKDSEGSVLRVLNAWKALGVKGWLEAKRPWFYFAEELGSKCAKIVGAEPEEVVVRHDHDKHTPACEHLLSATRNAEEGSGG